MSNTFPKEGAVQSKNWFWYSLVLVAALAFLPLVAMADEAKMATLPDGHPVIQIADENRMQNQSNLCWWSCAEMIAKQYGIEPLIGLREKVKKTGIGRDGGARQSDVQYWHSTLGVKIDTHMVGKTQEAIAWMRSRLDEGKPVIVGVYLPDHNRHALILTYLSYAKQDWDDGNGYKTNDFVINYIDPNDAHKTYSQPWSTFWARFDGCSWAYDVKPIPEATKTPDNAKQGHPVAPVGPPKGTGKIVDPGVMNRVQAQLAQTTQLNINPFQPAIDYVPGFVVDPPGGNPLVTGKVPSNQDIRDGVQRPSDMLENNAFGKYYFGGYDYYSEFKERVRTGQIRLPGEHKIPR
jgi:hypothetical protein